MIFGVHVKTTFALASTIQFNIWILFDFKEFFACMWFKIHNNLYTPDVWWLDQCGLHILAWEFVEVLNNWVDPI